MRAVGQIDTDPLPGRNLERRRATRYFAIHMFVRTVYTACHKRQDGGHAHDAPYERTKRRFPVLRPYRRPADDTVHEDPFEQKADAIDLPLVCLGVLFVPLLHRELLLAGAFSDEITVYDLFLHYFLLCLHKYMNK